MKPETVICVYRVKRGQEKPFELLLKRHWPTLQRQGLVTDEPSRIFRALAGDPMYFEIFTWLDGHTPHRAHEIPAVMEIWEAMGLLTESRPSGTNAMEFPHVKEMSLLARRPAKARRRKKARAAR